MMVYSAEHFLLYLNSAILLYQKLLFYTPDRIAWRQVFKIITLSGGNVRLSKKGLPCHGISSEHTLPELSILLPQ